MKDKFSVGDVLLNKHEDEIVLVVANTYFPQCVHLTDAQIGWKVDFSFVDGIKPRPYVFQVRDWAVIIIGVTAGTSKKLAEKNYVKIGEL